MTVLSSWSSDEDICVVYVAPWFPGQLGYRHRVAGDDSPDLAEEVAHFAIAEPLGRLIHVMGPPDADGITWWDDTTLERLADTVTPPRRGWMRLRRRRHV